MSRCTTLQALSGLLDKDFLLSGPPLESKILEATSKARIERRVSAAGSQPGTQAAASARVSHSKLQPTHQGQPHEGVCQQLLRSQADNDAASATCTAHMDRGGHVCAYVCAGLHDHVRRPGTICSSQWHLPVLGWSLRPVVKKRLSNTVGSCWHVDGVAAQQSPKQQAYKDGPLQPAP